MNGFFYLDAGSFKKPVDVYLITNCIDDAYVYANKNKAEKKIKEFPEYVVYEWPKLIYEETFGGKTFIRWDRAMKRVDGELQYDDTKIPWEMLRLAKEKSQWYTNRRFDSISFAMSKFANREYYQICGYDIPKEKEEPNRKDIWFPGFAGAQITDKNWLIEYKNNLHPNDDWTNVNIETYARWIGAIDYDERHNAINAALDANVVGYLD